MHMRGGRKRERETDSATESATETEPQREKGRKKERKKERNRGKEKERKRETEERRERKTQRPGTRRKALGLKSPTAPHNGTPCCNTAGNSAPRAAYSVPGGRSAMLFSIPQTSPSSDEGAAASEKAPSRPRPPIMCGDAAWVRVCVYRETEREWVTERE